MPLYRVRTNVLRGCCDPLLGKGWRCDAITSEDVNEARAKREFETEPWDQVKYQYKDIGEARLYHIRRIAYLTETPSEESPILVIESEVQGQRRIYYNDGNHRVAAAFVRRDHFIDIKVVVIEPDSIDQFLPGAKLLL